MEIPLKKTIIMLTLLITTIEVHAVTNTTLSNEEFTDKDYDQRFLLKEFTLNQYNHDDVVNEYILWEDTKKFWMSPYPHVNTLKITHKLPHNTRHIKFIPKLFPYISTLIINNTYFNKDGFSSFINQYQDCIETLIIQNCTISYHASLISKIKKLKQLTLCNTKLSSLDFLTQNITHLSISSNQLTKNQIINIYKYAPHLQELTLDADILNTNDIHDLWSNLKELTFLKIGTVTYTN